MASASTNAVTPPTAAITPTTHEASGRRLFSLFLSFCSSLSGLANESSPARTPDTTLLLSEVSADFETGDGVGACVSTVDGFV